jgi:hypothetical protein
VVLGSHARMPAQRQAMRSLLVRGPKMPIVACGLQLLEMVWAGAGADEACFGLRGLEKVARERRTGLTIG